METDLFAGVPVSDLDVASAWYESLLGAPPTFLPNDTEAVWEIGPHQYVYIVFSPEAAGHAIITIIASDFDDRIPDIAERGLAPASEETSENGMRKTTYNDPDGNEIAFGGPPIAS